MARQVSSWEKEIQFTDRDEDRYLHVCVWGPPHSGKTSFGGTAENPFFLAPEDGTISVSNRHYPMLKLQDGKPTYELCRSVLLDALESKGFFAENIIKTFVLDSVTKLNRLLINEIKIQTGHKVLQQNDWGVLYSRIEDIVSLVNSLPMDTIITSGEAVKTDPEDDAEQLVTVNMQGGFRNDFFDEFDYVLNSEERKRGNTPPTYWMWTQTHRGRKAKFRKPKEATPPPADIQDCTFAMIKEMVESYRQLENKENNE